LPTNDLQLPRQVLDSIRAHVEEAVKHSESGYSSAQEEEDAVTGALGENLRTKGDNTSPPKRKDRSGLGEPQAQPVSDFVKKN